MQVWVFEINSKEGYSYQLWGIYATFSDAMKEVGEYFDMNTRNVNKDDLSSVSVGVDFVQTKCLDDLHEWTERLKYYSKKGWETDYNNRITLRHIDVIGDPTPVEPYNIFQPVGSGILDTAPLYAEWDRQRKELQDAYRRCYPE